VKLGKAEVEIPAGALKERTVIRIENLDSVERISEGIQNETAGCAGYRFLPHGTQFAKPAVISLPYDEELNGSEGRLKTLATWYFNTGNSHWEKLERKEVDRKSSTVRSYTTHFTDMINATLSLPENSSPLEANINSIKSLEAAKADSGLVKPEGFEGGWSGSAGFSVSATLN
jgi:hypothetical protein